MELLRTYVMVIYLLQTYSVEGQCKKTITYYGYRTFCLRGVYLISLD